MFKQSLRHTPKELVGVTFAIQMMVHLTYHATYQIQQWFTHCLNQGASWQVLHGKWCLGAKVRRLSQAPSSDLIDLYQQLSKPPLQVNCQNLTCNLAWTADYGPRAEIQAHGSLVHGPWAAGRRQSSEVQASRLPPPGCRTGVTGAGCWIWSELVRVLGGVCWGCLRLGHWAVMDGWRRSWVFSFMDRIWSCQWFPR